MREKPHILGQLPSPHTRVVTVTDKLCISWPHLAEHKCTFKIGMDIHIWTFLIQSWRSVVLQRISKPEINRPKLVKLFLSTKYIQSNCDFYATEQKQGWGKHSTVMCTLWRFDKLGGLQEETSKNDSGCQARQVSRSSPETSNFSKQHNGNLQFNEQMDMNNLKTSNLYKYYKSINSIK